MTNSTIQAVAELAASQHSVFTRRQAAAMNLSSHRVATALAQGWLIELYPGVLCVRGAPRTYQQALMAATLAAGGHGAASHRSAARMHRLDGFTEATFIELSVERRYRWREEAPGWYGPLGRNVIAHHIDALEPCDIVEIGGIRVTNLARTLADLGSVVSDRRMVGRALTDARRRGLAIGSIRDTAERLHRPGQRGTGVLLRHLDAIAFEGRVPESWFEEFLAACLVDPRLPEIVPQYEINDRRGRFVARVDLAIPSVRLGLEAHSRRFHFGPQAEPLDEQRDMRAAACGWELLYLGWYASKRPAEVVAAVVEVVEARRRDLAAA
jgi:predicted transcriptional regulator of viral defense system